MFLVMSPSAGSRFLLFLPHVFAHSKTCLGDVRPRGAGGGESATWQDSRPGPVSEPHRGAERRPHVNEPSGSLGLRSRTQPVGE